MDHRGAQRIRFRWDYFADALKAFAFFGLTTVVANHHQVAQAYREIGLAGFAQVALGLVCLSLLAVGANYLWCLWLHQRGRESRGQGRRAASGETAGS